MRRTSARACSTKPTGSSSSPASTDGCFYPSKLHLPLLEARACSTRRLGRATLGRLRRSSRAMARPNLARRLLGLVKNSTQPTNGGSSPRRLMGIALHLDVDELERGSRLFQHAPALEPVVGARHLLGRDRRGIADHETALAQVLDLERGDLRILPGVVVDEIMQ